MSSKTKQRDTGLQPPVATAISPHWATGMLLLAAFLWGSGNLANKTILTHVDPASAVFLRTFIAAAALTWPAWCERVWCQPAGWLSSAAPGSLSFAVAVLLQQWGYQSATVTNASFLVNTACVLTPVLGVLMWRDRLRLHTVLAALLVLFGALLVSGAWHSLAGVNLGDGLCLLSAVFFALWVVQTGHHLERHPQPWTTTLIQCLCAALMSVPFVLICAPRYASVWVEALPAAVYLGLFSTAAAFGLTAVAQTRVSASTTAILVAAESFFGAGAGIVFLGERPAASVQIGAVLILTAIVVMALRPELREPRPVAEVAGPSEGALGALQFTRPGRMAGHAVKGRKG